MPNSQPVPPGSDTLLDESVVSANKKIYCFKHENNNFNTGLAENESTTTKLGFLYNYIYKEDLFN